ncbi:MAG: hypothetical protein ACFB6R_12660 [Alphaproteobacteria bacterium]
MKRAVGGGDGSGEGRGRRFAPLPVLALALTFAAAAGPFLPSQALAGGSGGKTGKATDEKPGFLEETVAMPMLVVPVTRNGRLWGQAYVALELVAPEEIWTVRSKVHDLQDTLVRTVHAHPLDMSGDPPRVGDAALEAVEPLFPTLIQSMNLTLGRKLIDRVLVPKVFLRPL